MPPDVFRDYLRKIEKNLATGSATEHTHRPALKAFLEAVGENITAVNEPQRVECGAPDYIIARARTPVGYVEAKDVGRSLDAAERSEQLARYRESLTNLLLTDYLEFRWYVEGEHRETARLATVTIDGRIRTRRGGIRAVSELLQKFFAQVVPTVGTPKELAQRMAALARMTRDLIQKTFKRESEEGMLHAQLKAFRETLIPFLTPAQFADMYAQTITYGLFAARVRVPIGQDFTREKAAWNLPKTNPFLRRLFNEIAGPGLDDRIAWLVDDLAHLLARADMAEILRDFGRRTRQEDPVVHFYETFLGAYNPQMRKTRGVYYTPEPVVSYIVRSLDHIVKTRFGRPLGLADTNTLILDPAVGTATFLYFVIQQVHETVAGTVGKGGWSSYVAEKLLPRVFGFELLMAPYAVAHMKLGILLQETGYDFTGDQRLGIYLTNALGEAITQAATLGFARFITDEANAAAEIKRDRPIMVVLGNPPYSVSSANQGDHIEQLMDRYKAAVRDERNIQPLSDDYIKFIRFAHDRIERTGYGVIGMITNHSYLSGLIHRGMREELMKSFDEIYVLNLHGNALMGETAPGGGLDENVFDIRQGVAISLFVRKREGESPAQVRYADLWGLREGKYRYLWENDVSTTEWQELEPVSPYFFFVPKDFDLLSEYERGWSVVDIFPVNSTGIKTHRDHFVIDFEEERLRSRIAEFRDETLSDDEVRERFKLRDTRDWKLPEARAKLQTREDWEDNFNRCLYRPFDIRPVYYSGDVIELPRPEVMHHMLQENIALLTCRQQFDVGFRHVLCSNKLTECCAVSLKSREVTYVFPLYLYKVSKKEQSLKGGGSVISLTLFESRPEYETRDPNLSPKFIAAVRQKLELDFVTEGKGDLENTFGPEDILHYAYAVFHSPTYRERYAEFLKIDFPRLPLTSDRELFKALVEKGEELVSLHLMESRKLDQLITRLPVFPVPGSDEVVKRHPRYLAPGESEPGTGELLEQGRVYINKTQYFEGIEPEVWEFQIGGYQVLHKWLKDRKGRKLTFDDLFHYQKIVVTLKETMRLMEEIDDLIPSWPIE
ncbi:MAG: type ISP restriction/modification enzyme [Anaerolineae bacterium]